MDVKKVNYEMQKSDALNVETFLTSIGLGNNYFFAMTKPSTLSRIVIGNIVDFANRNCIICFSEKEICLIMLSRFSNKKVTETIRISRDEIINIKLSNILISYMLKLNLNDSKMKFQVYKRFGKFTGLNKSLELFKNMYNIQ